MNINKCWQTVCDEQGYDLFLCYVKLVLFCVCLGEYIVGKVLAHTISYHLPSCPLTCHLPHPSPVDLADLETKRVCAAECAALLQSLGRDEELKALRRVVEALGSGAGVGRSVGVMM